MYVTLTASEIWKIISESNTTVVFGAVTGMGIGLIYFHPGRTGMRVALTRLGIRTLSWALGAELLILAFVSWVATQTFATCSHFTPIAAKSSTDMATPVLQCLHPDLFYTGTPAGYPFLALALVAFSAIVYVSHRLLEKPNLITATREAWESTRETATFVMQKANAYWSNRPTR